MDSSSLSSSQQQILLFLYRYRFLTSHQLQLLLNHPYIRLTNYHLNRLFILNYIHKHFSRTLGLGNQPAVYYLTTKSTQVLKSLPDISKRALNRIPKERYRSQGFIARALYLADFYLYLSQESVKTNHKLYFFTKTDLLAHPYVIHPLPDAYFARSDGEGETKRYFVDLLDDYTPRFALRRRLVQYSDYIDSEKFENTTGHPFPTLLFICPNLGLKIYLKKHLLRVKEATSLDTVSIFLSTTEEAFKGQWEPIDFDEDVD